MWSDGTGFTSATLHMPMSGDQPGSALESLYSPDPLAPPARRGPIVAALAWLANAFLDGFAAYANSMYPCLPLPDEPPDRRMSAPVQVAAYPCAAGHNRTHARGWFAARRPSPRRQPKVSDATNDLWALDERMLRDIGISRDQLEQFLRHETLPE